MVRTREWKGAEEGKECLRKENRMEETGIK
jgi:hypothetical protein